ncbi:MAG TPA: hypothetical protein VFK28_01190 [Sphingomicrobium sp.]|jgi:hypothetical protein|nr:hypothetical protein [Sphingomicrobium sp.]
MATDPVQLGDDPLGEALAFMESALKLLDRAAAPAHIGAHLDLAICELQESIATAFAPASPAPGRRS